MKALLAFIKKEGMEQLRSGRLLLLGMVFVLLGIMNPAIAKLTPWLMEIMADSLAETGMTVGTVTVDALTSWTQFFKNIPIGLIAFVLMEGPIFTREYQSGTLTLVLTKGFQRYKAVVSKTAILMVLWSACYWLCFFITYGYNEYFWENGIVHHLGLAAFDWWLFGLWIMTAVVFFSGIMRTGSGVLAGTGVVFLGSWLLSLFPRAKAFSPALLMESAVLLSGAEGVPYCRSAIIVTVLLCVVSVAVVIPIINKKEL